MSEFWSFLKFYWNITLTFYNIKIITSVYSTKIRRAIQIVLVQYLITIWICSSTAEWNNFWHIIIKLTSALSFFFVPRQDQVVFICNKFFEFTHSSSFSFLLCNKNVKNNGNYVCKDEKFRDVISYNVSIVTTTI